MRLVVVGPRHRQPQLRAELRLGETVDTKGFLGVVGLDIGITASRGYPNGGQRSGAATRVRYSELLDRFAKPLPNQIDWRQSDHSVFVVVDAT